MKSHIADHIAMLSGGKVIEWAPTAQFVRSREPIVRGFLERNLVLPEGPDDVASLPTAG